MREFRQLARCGQAASKRLGAVASSPLSASPASCALVSTSATTASAAAARNGTYTAVRSMSHAPRSNMTASKARQQQQLSSLAAAAAGDKGQSRPYSAAAAPEEPRVHDIFEDVTGTWQYVVADPSTKTAAIIDPVLNFDPATQKLSTDTADALLALVADEGYKVDWILETHAHADHLTAAAYLRRRLEQAQGYAPSIGIGQRIGQVQQLFGSKYEIPAEELDGVFDKLFADDEEFSIGSIKASAIHTPGHTPDHLGYKIGDNVFCGDSIFHVDLGTARCDFPGGSADSLYDSGRKLLGLPDHVKLWIGHDYPSGQRTEPVAWKSVGEHRRRNKHLRDGISRSDFVALRQQRDATLAAPRLIHQSLQVNTRAGRLPRPTASGDVMLRMPLRAMDVPM